MADIDNKEMIEQCRMVGTKQRKLFVGTDATKFFK
jgi:hypothetical protein